MQYCGKLRNASHFLFSKQTPILVQTDDEKRAGLRGKIMCIMIIAGQYVIMVHG